jgi:integrase
VAYGHEGERHKAPTRSTNKSDAIKLKKKLLRELWGGKLPWLEEEEPTLADLLDLVKTHYANEGNRSVKRMELSIRTMLAFPTWNKGKVKARKITEARIDEFKTWRKQGGGVALKKLKDGSARARKPATNGAINRDLAVLRQAFNIATKRLDENGHALVARAPRIQLMREAPPREGFFEDDEFEKVHRALRAGDERSGPEDLSDLAEFYFLTGWRSAEPRALEWRTCNWFSDTLTLPAAVNKSGQARVLPFGGWPRLKKLLEKRRRITEAVEAQLDAARGDGERRKVPFIFHRGGDPIRYFRRAWISACKRAGLEERKPHDFRRTACRNVYLATGDLLAACYMVGWETIAMAKRYKIDTLRDRAAAVAKVAAWEMEKTREREAALQMTLRFEKKTG